MYVEHTSIALHAEVPEMLLHLNLNVFKLRLCLSYFLSRSVLIKYITF